jgi:hypothetical protein
MSRERLQHGHALAHVEQRVLIRIPENCHDQLVKNFAAPLDQVQVTIRGGIKRPGINGDGFVQRSSRKSRCKLASLDFSGAGTGMANDSVAPY